MEKKMISGWTGKILWFDLSNQIIEIKSSEPYFKQYLGGRGFAARIAWDYIKHNTKAFDPNNILMFFTGPLTGTSAPYSGRGIVCGVSPHTYPECYTRSGIGGYWATELKYAGYDGLVIKGRLTDPGYILIENNKAEIRNAKEYWGMGSIEVQKALLKEVGLGFKIMAIGPAGENLSRIAIINSGTESAAGQGGFGAVMGYKKLKAIVIKGTGGVNVALPIELAKKSKIINNFVSGSHHQPRKGILNEEKVKKYGEQFQACSQQCLIKCISSRYYKDVYCPISEKKISGQMHCAANLFQGLPNNQFYNWNIGFEAGFEIAQLANELGLNHWELIFGIVPWLRYCKDNNIISAIDDVEINENNSNYWCKLLEKIAFREGMGDVLAEGGFRAAKTIGGSKKINNFYTAWGFAGHFDGHADHANYIVFPYWLVSALLWATDTRDPISSSHGYVEAIMNFSPIAEDGGTITWDQILSASRRLYDTKKACARDSGYLCKEKPAIFSNHKSVIKDSLLLCDQCFPIMFSKYESDGIAKSEDMEAPSFEYNLFISATGIDITEDQFNKSAERIYNLERLIQIRNNKRTRLVDENVIKAFEEEENLKSYLQGIIYLEVGILKQGGH